MKSSMKLVAIFTTSLVLLAACGNETEQGTGQSSDQAAATEEADVVTTASVVDNGAAFLNAAGAEGTWIIATLQDLEIDEEIVLTGDFTNRGEPARKIALYEQDSERNVTARYTLTAPRLVVESPNARIQGGTFVGDVYVDAPDFLVIDATVDGDITFSSTAYRESFRTENGGTVTGDLTVEE